MLDGVRKILARHPRLQAVVGNAATRIRLTAMLTAKRLTSGLDRAIDDARPRINIGGGIFFRRHWRDSTNRWWQ